MAHARRLLLPLSTLFFLLVFSGCLSRITTIYAPSETTIDEEFVIAVDGTVSGSGGGMVALIVQIPDEFEYIDAAYTCTSAHRALRRNRRIESRFRAEEHHQVLALADSIPFARVSSEDVRVFVRLKPTKLGTYTCSFATGAVFESGGQAVWKCTDPEDLRDFSADSEPVHRATITVIEPERNGTAAISFSGEREHVALPDSGVFHFDLAHDFTIETWFSTTSRDGVLLSTRVDDFNGPFPIELGIDAYGAVSLSACAGDSVVSTAGRAFFADGRWHHLAVAYTAASRMYEIYVDALFTDRLTVPAGAERRGMPIIGGRASKRRFFTGLLDEFRAWTDARTQEQVGYYKNIALSGYEEGLYAMYTFDKGEEGRIPNSTPAEGLEAVAFNRPKLVPSTAPLKVELVSFSVTNDQQNVQMSWESFDESKVKRYVIEKRSESGKYTTLYSVEPQRLKEKHQTYRFTDEWNGKSLVHYRLRKEATDGNVRFSDEVPIGSESVLNFTLGDNEPNPFTDKTVIPYTLSEKAFVTLHVYDIMGRLITELVAAKQAAGDYRVTFEAGDAPAGQYFYKMRTSSGAVTKKMYLSR